MLELRRLSTLNSEAHLSLVFACHFHCSLALSSNKHHACSSSSISGGVSSQVLFVFINGIQVCVASLLARRCNVSCFATSPAHPVVARATFLLSFASFLATVFSVHEFFPPRRAPLPPLPPGFPFPFQFGSFSGLQLPFACSFRNQPPVRCP